MYWIENIKIKAIFIIIYIIFLKDNTSSNVKEIYVFKILCTSILLEAIVALNQLDITENQHICYITTTNPIQITSSLSLFGRRSCDCELWYL